MKDDRLYLIHIGECIERIDSYVQRVWNIIENEIPVLKEAVRKMLD